MILRTFLIPLLSILMLTSISAQNDWYILSEFGDTLAKVNCETLSPGGEMIKIKKAGRFGFIDYRGRSVLKPRFEQVRRYKDGFACVKWNGKYGYMDNKERMLIPAIYEEASSFSEGLARVKMQDKWGYINTSGELVINYSYTEASSFAEGYAFVRKKWETTFGLINKKDELTIPATYRRLLFPQEGLVRAQKDGKWGYLDTKGNVVIDHKFKYAFSFSEGLAFFAISENQYGVIDRKGNVIVEPKFKKVKTRGFSDGLAAVMVDGKWGYINTQGELAIPAIYEDCQLFSRKKAAVKVGDYWGYIDTNGEELISPRYPEASSIFDSNKRPVMVVKGSDYVPPTPEPEVEEEEVVEESVVEEEVQVEEKEETTKNPTVVLEEETTKNPTAVLEEEKEETGKQTTPIKEEKLAEESTKENDTPKLTNQGKKPSASQITSSLQDVQDDLAEAKKAMIATLNLLNNSTETSQVKDLETSKAYVKKAMSLVDGSSRKIIKTTSLALEVKGCKLPEESFFEAVGFLNNGMIQLHRSNDVLNYDFNDQTASSFGKRFKDFNSLLSKAMDTVEDIQSKALDCMVGK